MFLVLSANTNMLFDALILFLSFSIVFINSSFTLRNFTLSRSCARSSSKGLSAATCGAFCFVLKPYVVAGLGRGVLSFSCR